MRLMDDSKSDGGLSEEYLLADASLISTFLQYAKCQEAWGRGKLNQSRDEAFSLFSSYLLRVFLKQH